MTYSDIVSTVGAVAAVIGAVAYLADMKDDGRARLKRWTTTAASVGWRWANWIFALVSLGNGILGIAIFYVLTTPPTRQDVVHLLIFVANIAIGCWRFWAMADAFEKSKKDRSSALTSNSSTA